MNKNKTLKILGLMSGTSMDGLDCGLFNINLNQKYNFNWECIDFKTFKYCEEIKENISNSLNGDIETINSLNDLLGQEVALLSKKFIGEKSIDYIALHGQTIAHEDGVSSRQVSDPKYLHQNFNVPVIYDFRQNDIMQGGNGAPLMPFLDWLLFKNSFADIITLNIGGISNISHIPRSHKKNDVIGFDTGPGMSLIDECCKFFYNESYDRDAKYSINGKINFKILDELMLNDFIDKAPPKSTGRQDFGADTIYYYKKKYPDILVSDFLRTYCAFTAKSISYNITKFLNFNRSNVKLIVSGGGAHHPIVMEYIKKFILFKNIETIDSYGISIDMKESLLMAVLGAAYVNKIPANIPSVTGAKKLTILGKLYN